MSVGLLETCRFGYGRGGERYDLDGLVRFQIPWVVATQSYILQHFSIDVALPFSIPLTLQWKTMKLGNAKATW